MKTFKGNILEVKKQVLEYFERNTKEFDKEHLDIYFEKADGDNIFTNIEYRDKYDDTDYVGINSFSLINEAIEVELTGLTEIKSDKKE